MPMSQDFEDRLYPALDSIADYFGTPFYLYDSAGLDNHVAEFEKAFCDLPTREFFPVKASPNPALLARLRRHGHGFDCSSPVELRLALEAGAAGCDLVYTSNNTSLAELTDAIDAGARITIDDAATLERLVRADRVPEQLLVRINPGEQSPRYTTTTFAAARDSKFGVPVTQLVEVCARAREAGARSFGLHMMVSSNWLQAGPALSTLDTLVDSAIRLHDELGIEVDVLDVGGGFGIPFRPGDPPLDLEEVADGYRTTLEHWPTPRCPRIYFEHGIFLTGAHGVLVTRVVNRMSKWRDVVGVDVSTNALMRPVLYGEAYHHITVPSASGRPTEEVDVVGSLCTDLDKLASERELPAVVEGDLLVIHDSGAHGLAWGHNYNGRLRPKELLLDADGTVRLIRRAEDEDDYLATLSFDERAFRPSQTA